DREGRAAAAGRLRRGAVHRLRAEERHRAAADARTARTARSRERRVGRSCHGRDPAVMTLRVAIVDDEPHARAAVRTLLEARGGIEIVAEGRNGSEAIAPTPLVGGRLLVLGVQVPGRGGFGVLLPLGPG